MEIEKIFANNLKECRKQLGMTQNELAQKIEYTGKSISKWESGSFVAPTDALLKLAKALEVTVDYLLTPKSEIKYYLGIHGGDAEITFRLCDDREITIREETISSYDSMEKTDGVRAIVENIKMTIKHVCKGIPFNEISMFAGMAGVTENKLEDVFEDLFKRFNFGLHKLSSEGLNLQALHSTDINYISVIVGSGVVASCIYKGVMYSAGGKGYLFDKGGNAYTIGKDAISAGYADYDGYGKPTIIKSIIEEKCKCNILENMSKFYSLGKYYISSFASAAIEAYKLGDEIASEIINQNMKCLAVIINHLAKKFDQNNIDVFLSGDLMKEKAVFFPILEKYLTKGKNFALHHIDRPLVEGAVINAKRMAQNM